MAKEMGHDRARVHPTYAGAHSPGIRSPRGTFAVRQTAICIALLLMSACSVVGPQKTVRGNRIDPDQLKELIVGTSSRADATSLLGTPTARAAFDDNTWLYIHEVTEPRIGRTPGIVEQDVVILTFDANGTLRDLKHLDADAAQPVQVVSRTTPSPGGEASFLQQLLGNIGRFSPVGNTSSGNGISTGSSQ